MSLKIAHIAPSIKQTAYQEQVQELGNMLIEKWTKQDQQKQLAKLNTKTPKTKKP